MKMKLVCVLIALCIAVHMSSASQGSKWEAYKAKYNKQYDNPVVDRIHRRKWQEAVVRVAQHNRKYAAGEVGWQAGINDRSDWTVEQLDAARNNYVRTVE